MKEFESMLSDLAQKEFKDLMRNNPMPLEIAELPQVKLALKKFFVFAYRRGYLTCMEDFSILKKGDQDNENINSSDS